ncbi:MAG: hypothetical protein HQM12_01775 [SAR324 cluster bacterium]|nr:hypothetical protein [SAR324 cluster bacterium]
MSMIRPQSSVKIVLSLCILLFGGNLWLLRAIEMEDRLPPFVLQAGLNLSSLEYYGAYGGNFHRASLKDLIIRDNQYRTRLDGRIRREETRYTWNMLYGLSENWQIGLEIPYIIREQRADLTITTTEGLSADESSDIQEIIDYFNTSQHVEGTGDISLKLGYDMHYSNTLLVRSGIIIQTPLNTTEAPRGIYPWEVSENQTDVTGFFHFTRYPYSRYQIRNNLRISMTNQLVGERETLAGHKVKYFGGNALDLRYNWIYEFNNGLVGAELQRSQGEDSNLNGQNQKNRSVLHQLNFELGQGNYQDLEQKTVLFPYQFRTGFRLPLGGMNIPYVYQIYFTFQAYF